MLGHVSAGAPPFQAFNDLYAAVSDPRRSKQVLSLGKGGNVRFVDRPDQCKAPKATNAHLKRTLLSRYPVHDGNDQAMRQEMALLLDQALPDDSTVTAGEFRKIMDGIEQGVHSAWNRRQALLPDDVENLGSLHFQEADLGFFAATRLAQSARHQCGIYGSDTPPSEAQARLDALTARLPMLDAIKRSAERRLNDYSVAQGGRPLHVRGFWQSSLEGSTEPRTAATRIGFGLELVPRAARHGALARQAEEARRKADGYLSVVPSYLRRADDKTHYCDLIDALTDDEKKALHSVSQMGKAFSNSEAELLAFRRLKLSAIERDARHVDRFLDQLGPESDPEAALAEAPRETVASIVSMFEAKCEPQMSRCVSLGLTKDRCRALLDRKFAGQTSLSKEVPRTGLGGQSGETTQENVYRLSNHLRLQGNRYSHPFEQMVYDYGRDSIRQRCQAEDLAAAASQVLRYESWENACCRYFEAAGSLPQASAEDRRLASLSKHHLSVANLRHNFLQREAAAIIESEMQAVEARAQVPRERVREAKPLPANIRPVSTTSPPPAQHPGAGQPPGPTPSRPTDRMARAVVSAVEDLPLAGLPDDAPEGREVAIRRADGSIAFQAADAVLPEGAATLTRKHAVEALSRFYSDRAVDGLGGMTPDAPVTRAELRSLVVQARCSHAHANMLRIAMAPDARQADATLNEASREAIAFVRASLAGDGNALHDVGVGVELLRAALHSYDKSLAEEVAGPQDGRAPFDFGRVTDRKTFKKFFDGRSDARLSMTKLQRLMRDLGCTHYTRDGSGRGFELRTRDEAGNVASHNYFFHMPHGGDDVVIEEATLLGLRRWIFEHIGWPEGHDRPARLQGVGVDE